MFRHVVTLTTVCLMSAVALAGGWFDSPVEFWQEPTVVIAVKASNPKKTKTKETKSKQGSHDDPTVQESIWAEPTRLPDGRWVTYLPPRPVLLHLSNPTRETARAYLKWQQERLSAIAKATDLIQEVANESIKPDVLPAKPSDAPKADQTENQKRVPLPGEKARFQLLYFFAPDCPHCERQEPLIEALGRSYPQLTIKGIAMAKDVASLTRYVEKRRVSGASYPLFLSSGLAQAFGVTATPTCIFIDTQRHSATRLDAFANTESLERHVANLLSGGNQ
ncbi:TlpA family protein disulfide reductase [bacterium AH-315-F18]|nr:TlpA family protein disulfide reductase [bacterium AH-315-F18]